MHRACADSALSVRKVLFVRGKVLFVRGEVLFVREKVLFVRDFVSAGIIVRKEYRNSTSLT